MFRTLSTVLAVLALVCYAVPARAAATVQEENATHEGVYVKAEDNKLYLKEKDDKEHVYDLEAKPAVTSDGTSIKLSDLKPGMKLKITVGANKKVNRIETSNTREGVYVKAEDNKLYLKEKDNKEHAYDLEAKPTVTSNGAARQLTDLKVGDNLKITIGINNKVNKIEATSK
jgi:TusA-related sulfurtransferase